MNLPFSENLTTNKLASSFANTSATYKFYWLIAIIELVENGQKNIKKRDIFSRMISNSWYTVNYFHVSFGKQDLIQKAVQNILKFESLPIDIKKENLISILENSRKIETSKSLEHFNLNVPHWFLSPWFPKIKNENDSNYKKRIYSSSQNFENGCLYGLYDEFIVINPIWINYLKLNAKILKDFCYWNLSLFLQSRNPNVPDIPNKLIKPATRNTLTKQRTNYWNIVFKELGSVNCIFTDNKLRIDNFAIDHFIPHAFVSHDLVWNLIPIDKSFNCSKSDRLPPIDKYFDKFFNLQKTAFEIIYNENPKNKLIEDYLTIFPQLKSVNDFEYLRYKESIQPLITIAHNNGFSYIND
jgi:hypothetical protein